MPEYWHLEPSNITDLHTKRLASFSFLFFKQYVCLFFSLNTLNHFMQLLKAKSLGLSEKKYNNIITKTRPCSILEFFTAVKIIIFR